MYGIVPYTALFLYPFVVVLFFNRMSSIRALIWSLLAGYMFLPQRVAFDLPFLPSIDKHSVPAMTAGLVLMIRGRETMRRNARAAAAKLADSSARLTGAARRAAHRHRNPIVVILLLFILLIPIAIVASNSTPMITGPRFIRGMTPKDAASMSLSAMVMLLPFILARRHLGTREAHLAILTALVTGAMIYSVLMLFEVRFSPQLHRMIYGFHQHSFVQHIRAGFRPMVFMGHGLEVGLFICMSCLACATLWRNARQNRRGAADASHNTRKQPDAPAPQSAEDDVQTNSPRTRKINPLMIPRHWALRLGWLAVILYLSRNLGATGIMLALSPIILFAPIRFQILVATVISATVLIYPMLRGADLVPVDRVISMAASINEQRAESLAYRIRNEDALLAKAQEKPLLGWGSWGRNRIYDERTGEDISVTDGSWVIIIGISGWSGYIARFGLLTLPIFLLWRRRASLDVVTTGLGVILAANLIDLIPNSGLTPISWMIAGALVGWAEQNAPVRAHAKNRRAAGRRRTHDTVAARS